MQWPAKMHSSTDHSYILIALTTSLAGIIGFLQRGRVRNKGIKSIFLLYCKTIPSVICKREAAWLSELLGWNVCAEQVYPVSSSPVCHIGNATVSRWPSAGTGRRDAGMGAFLLTHPPENVWKTPAIWGISSLTQLLFRSHLGVSGETERGEKKCFQLPFSLTVELEKPWMCQQQWYHLCHGWAISLGQAHKRN